jgi:hypothetical protein
MKKYSGQSCSDSEDYVLDWDVWEEDEDDDD